MNSTPGPESLDRKSLTAPARKATGRPALEVVDWECRSIHIPLNQATGGVYRVAGTGRDGDEIVRWSMILKMAQKAVGLQVGTVDPTHFNYWKREATLYQTKLLDDLQGVRAPRCYGVVEHGETSAWLWLEDVRDPTGSCWPVDRYRVAARHLGHFNAAYVVERPLPDEPCLTRDSLRSQMANMPSFVARLPEVRDHPYVRRSCPTELLERLLRLWSDKEQMLDALDRLPLTFCHLDAFPRNLLMHTGPDGIEETVAVDWGFSGFAPLGADLAPMVGANVLFFDADPEQIPEIDALVFDSYVEGLRAAGWRGDTRVIRFGFVASAALRYGLVPLMLAVRMMDEQWRVRYEQSLGHKADEILDCGAAVGTFLMDQADEARALLRTLGPALGAPACYRPGRSHRRLRRMQGRTVCAWLCPPRFATAHSADYGSA